VNSERKCPLCGSPQTNIYAFVKSGELVKLPFDQQKCSSPDCGLLCNLWDGAQQPVEAKEMKP